MSVILFPTDRTDTFELCFGIRTKSGSELSEISEPDYSVEGSRTYIPLASKSLVLSAICEAVSLLVSEVFPTYITMETYDANLPPAALDKYRQIGAQIAGLGYLVNDSFRDPDTGINYWLFEQRD